MNKILKLTKWTVAILLILIPLSVTIARSDNAKNIVPILALLLFDDDEVKALKPLNDTGSDWGGGFFSGNNSGCTSNITSPQDCHQGRDATHDDDSDGHAGFSFTKVDSGNCVQDNVTGLMWEVKTDDGGLHDMDDTYNWYNTDSATNGGEFGSADDDGDICYGYDSADAATFCNTQSYVARVNDAGWCGYSDWRLPDRDELHSIVDYSLVGPSIDRNYFPNTAVKSFWSASPQATSPWWVWLANFHIGYFSNDSTYENYYVRLVRGGL